MFSLRFSYENSSLFSSLEVRSHVTRPYKTTGKTVVSRPLSIPFLLIILPETLGSVVREICPKQLFSLSRTAQDTAEKYRCIKWDWYRWYNMWYDIQFDIFTYILWDISVYLSIFYSQASLQICKIYRFNQFYKNL